MAKAWVYNANASIWEPLGAGMTSIEADALFLKPVDVVAGANITVDRTTTPGSVIISGLAGGGGGGGAIYEAPLDSPPEPADGIWRII